MDFRKPAALHDAFALQAKKQFRALLARTGGSTAFASSSSSSYPGGPSSGPRSWSNGNHLSQHMSSSSSKEDRIDINARDGLGRTILHIVAYSLEPHALDYLRLILDTHPKSGININLQDVESGWTALHRALWVGNLAAARMLLAEDKIDASVKDFEGLTCWDLYNSTVEGTNPPEDAAVGDTLYTWGANRNQTLGHGEGNDRSLPDKVHLTRIEKPDYVPVGEEEDKRRERGDRRRFDGVSIREVQMAKLHTGVVTAERTNNVNLCGFGSGGRLGRSVHSQAELVPIPDFPHSIASVALGQDHTLALTTSGHVLSWGLNRFGVLGYALDAPALGSKFQSAPEEAIQVTPRRIVGSFKKEEVLGVAASRCSSACWTEDAVWTWGLNNGQLGYDVSSNPIQVIPRKVAALTQPVIGLAITDYALVCLLASHEVLCFYRGGSTKVNFPTSPFFAESAIYRPPEFRKRSEVVKVTSSGITFACLTSLGDVFTFALPSPTEADRDAAANGAPRERNTQIKPQRAWALRKRFTAVKDVALGSDGGIILATQSGHVFVRTRNTKVGSGGGSGGGSSKAFKFQRIPYLQRIIKVSANESGAYGAVRADAVPKAIDPSGPSIGDDLTHLLPHVRRWMEGRRGSFLLEQSENHVVSTDEDGETESTPVRADIKIARQLVQIVDTWKPSSSYPPLFGVAGSDCVLHAAGRDTPAHQVILATRSSVLRRLLAGDKMPSCRISVERTPEGLVRLHLPKSDHLTVLLLLQYLYSDDLPAVWDPRVGREIQDRSLSSRTVNLASVRSELRVLAETLELGALSSILQLSSKTSPTPLLMTDLSHTFEAAQAILHSPSPSASPLRPDVIIELADRTVGGHESILRSRSPFFSALFDESEWTRSRRDEAGNITVNLRHLRWSTMRPVFRYLYEDVGAELFDYHHQETVDQFLDFVFEVLAAANELLLDQLILICSSVVLRHVTTHNVCSLLSDASFYHAVDLKRSLQGYIARNMETMLESHLLDPMPNDTLDELATFVIGRQGERLPISRSGILVTSAMDRQRDWLAMEDFPKLSLKSTKPGAQASSKAERSPKLSPAASGLTALPLARPSPRRTSYSVPISPLASPAMHAQVSSEDVEDGLFSMDEEVGIVDRLANGLVGSLSLGERAVPLETPSRVPSSSSKPVWKSKAVEAERTDLRSIMAEASTSTRPRLPSSSSSATARPSDALPTPTFKLSQKDRKKAALAQSSNSSPIHAATTPPSSLPSTPWRLPASTLSPAQPSPFQPSPPMSAQSSMRGFPPPAPRKDSLPISSSPVSASRAGSSTGPGTARPTASTAATPSSMFGASSPSNASRNVIVPQRSVSSSSTPAKKSSATWSIPTFTAPPPPPILSPQSAATASFAHIQQQQRDDKFVRDSPVPKKSLMQIQQEEAEQKRAQKEEAEFMVWWEEEEKRIAAQAAIAAQGAGGSGSVGKKGGKSAAAKGGKKVQAPATANGSGKGGAPKQAPTPQPQRGEGSSGTAVRGGKGKASGRPSGGGPRTSNASAAPVVVPPPASPLVPLNGSGGGGAGKPLNPQVKAFVFGQ